MIRCHRPPCHDTTPRAPCRLATAVLIGLFALSLNGCGKKEEKSAENITASRNEGLPVAEPPLSRAVIRGNLEEVKKLIESGSDINGRDALDRTPLHMAAFYGRIKASDALIAAGADINARDHVGMTPLHAAVISGGKQISLMLLDRNANIAARNEAGQTALHLSAATGQPKLTKALIERGADPKNRDSDGNLPLYYAKKNFHPQTAAVIEQAMAKAVPASTGAPPR